jgi:anti-sigma B factor antagonist
MIKMNTKEQNGWIAVSIEGEIDLHSSPEIRRELAGHVKVKKAKVLIDLAQVTYIDSSGLATFIEAMQKLRKVGGEIALAGLSESVRHVFEVARLDSVFKIAKNKEELLG